MTCNLSPPSLASFIQLTSRSAFQSWVLAVILDFSIMKNAIFAISIKWIWLGIGLFNRHGSEVDYFYSKNGLEVTFWTTLQNRKPQMPCDAHCVFKSAKSINFSWIKDWLNLLNPYRSLLHSLLLIHYSSISKTARIITLVSEAHWKERFWRDEEIFCITGCLNWRKTIRNLFIFPPWPGHNWSIRWLQNRRFCLRPTVNLDQTCF